MRVLKFPNNQPPELHCMLTYIMYDTRNVPYKHYKVLASSKQAWQEMKTSETISDSAECNV